MLRRPESLRSCPSAYPSALALHSNGGTARRVYAIQQRAGHKNISNTMIYTHISDQQAGDACKAALMSAFAVGDNLLIL